VRRDPGASTAPSRKLVCLQAMGIDTPLMIILTFARCRGNDESLRRRSNPEVVMH